MVDAFIDICDSQYLFLYIFSIEKGIVSQKLGSFKSVRFVSEQSNYAFLIHSIVFKYVNAFLDNRFISSGYREVYLLLIGAIITCGCTMVYMSLIEKKI